MGERVEDDGGRGPRHGPTGSGARDRAACLYHPVCCRLKRQTPKQASSKVASERMRKCMRARCPRVRSGCCVQFPMRPRCHQAYFGQLYTRTYVFSFVSVVPVLPDLPVVSVVAVGPKIEGSLGGLPYSCSSPGFRGASSRAPLLGQCSALKSLGALPRRDPPRGHTVRTRQIARGR